MNIQFLDREEELKIINKLNKNNFFIIIKGRRRIGKTTFLQKVFQNAVYIFIWPNKSIEWINNEVCKENNLPLFKNFGDIIKYLLEKKKTIIIDEFQNFLSVEKSIYGEIQKIIDENKNKFLKMAVAGSSYSLINKVFNDVASPLYGRKSAELTLSHLPIKDIFKEVKRPLEEFIKFWSIFQGVPYYYEFINKEPFEKLIKQLFLSKNALLREEGKSILAMEFGSNSKNYNTVLSAISEGKTKFNEISSFFGGKKNETIKYLDLLRKEFKLVKRLTPVTSDPKKTKEGIYSIKDNLLEFWFNFVDKQQIYAEQDRFEEIELFFDKNFNSYAGKKFEDFCETIIKEKTITIFNYPKVGKQWGKNQKTKKVYEIDLVALNEDTKEICFIECKWKETVNAEEIIKELIEKTKFVEWNNNSRKESFAIFAKSFKKKIKEFDNKIVHCFDLNDLEKLL